MNDVVPAAAVGPEHSDVTPVRGLIKFTPPPPYPHAAHDPHAVNGAASRCPVKAEMPGGRVAWLVGAYEQVHQVVTDLRFSRARAIEDGHAQGLEVFASGTLIGTDPPTHTRLRKLVTSAFTLRRIEALRPRVAQIVGELITAILDAPQPADLVTSFALPLPVQVICEMLGVPAGDIGRFREWTSAVIGDWERDSDEILTALAELTMYFEGLIKVKQDQPGEDLLSALIAGRDDGDRLSQEELTMMGCTILIGGFETTANMISLSVLALLDNPAEMAMLRADPGLITRAADELIRYVRIGSTPLSRVATEDIELGGVIIPAGEAVLPLFATANRDPSVFNDPDRLDLSRPLASHLGFGAGIHHCLGSQLARMEVQEALRGVVTQLPDLTLAVPARELMFQSGMGIHNLCGLPVMWTEK